MKSKLTCYTAGDGQYLMDVAGRYGGGYRARVIGTTPAEAASALRMEIRQFIGSNPEGGEFTAPPEVLEAMASGTVDGAPVRGARISYYASPEALQVIQARREATGGSQSGVINALVVAGAKGYDAPDTNGI